MNTIAIGTVMMTEAAVINPQSTWTPSKKCMTPTVRVSLDVELMKIRANR